MKSLLIFPHQLHQDHPGLQENPDEIYLIEDSLFFGDYEFPLQFHKQKLWLHRASMKRYEQKLIQGDYKVTYLEYKDGAQILVGLLKKLEGELIVVDPTDFVLRKRLENHKGKITILPNPNFLNTPEQNKSYRVDKNRWFMADFYKYQRQRLDILMEDGEPVGGQWSYDEDNRKKIPKNKLSDIPKPRFVNMDEIDKAAKQYVEEKFSNNLGSLETLYYPTSHESADQWLQQFLDKRFKDFGPYEDAIEEGESWLWHSILTPMLNIGLLTPSQVIEQALEKDVPLNSKEGFIRQIIGWREFMRATYEDLGVTMRTTNHWQHTRKIPSSFYDGSTGIDPIDDTIKRILQTGYCHHIERLMVLGGFFFLCEFDPDEIYNWFMEMFVDSYDWVMVPNVYAMSQNADGGLITTKPYFSGSAYVRKMSHWKEGEWSEIWDGLYWRWIWNHREELQNNPRWAMMVSMIEKMEPAKRQSHLDAATKYLKSL